MIWLKVISTYLMFIVVPSLLLVWAAYVGLPVVWQGLQVERWPDVGRNTMVVASIAASVGVIWAYHRQVAPRWRRWAHPLALSAQASAQDPDQ